MESNLCVYSNVGEYFHRTIPDRYPNIFTTGRITFQPEITKEDFDSLKRDVEELKLLLKAAKRYDQKTGQADCETEDKVAFVRQVAEFVGVDLEDVLEEA